MTKKPLFINIYNIQGEICSNAICSLEQAEYGCKPFDNGTYLHSLKISGETGYFIEMVKLQYKKLNLIIGKEYCFKDDATVRFIYSGEINRNNQIIQVFKHKSKPSIQEHFSFEQADELLEEVKNAQKPTPNNN